MVLFKNLKDEQKFNSIVNFIKWRRSILYKRKYRKENNNKIKEYRENNKDKSKVYSKEYYEKNKEVIKDRSLDWAQKNSEKIKKNKSDYRKNNSDRVRNYNLEYGFKNEDEIKKYKEKYYKDNKDKFLEKSKKWKKNNREKTNLFARLRNRPKQMTPLVKSYKTEIKCFYDEAKRLTQETGTRYVVDHIMPLIGTNFSGLHVPWNLQVITESENCKKSNKAVL